MSALHNYQLYVTLKIFKEITKKVNVELYLPNIIIQSRYIMTSLQGRHDITLHSTEYAPTITFKDTS